MDQVLVRRRLAGAESNALFTADALHPLGEIAASECVSKPFTRAGGDLIGGEERISALGDVVVDAHHHQILGDAAVARAAVRIAHAHPLSQPILVAEALDGEDLTVWFGPAILDDRAVRVRGIDEIDAFTVGESPGCPDYLLHHVLERLQQRVVDSAFLRVCTRPNSHVFSSPSVITAMLYISDIETSMQWLNPYWLEKVVIAFWLDRIYIYSRREVSADPLRRQILMANLALPGNPRYQPQELVGIFGYDHLYRGVAEVELANLDVLAEIGFIPAEDYRLLSRRLRRTFLGITTTKVDEREGKTRHDIRAWVQLAQERSPRNLGRWIHTALTSYDPLDTGRILTYVKAHHQVIRPAIQEVGLLMADLVERFADTLQLGRTHLQAALPITVGFWLATILSRVLYVAEKIDQFGDDLVGKVSGAVGAYNAQKGLGILDRCGEVSFETRLLEKLGLRPARISTQILPPEPLTFFLFANCMLAAAFGQFGRDARNLMRTEIAEFVQTKGPGEIGSSTMVHKTNPITFEQLEGMWIRTRNEFGKVMDTTISDLQRDLVGSSVARDFPIIIVNLLVQLNSLRKKNDAGVPFLRRVSVNPERCRANFEPVAHVILAEPIQLAFQMAGYAGDGYKLVADRLLPEAVGTGKMLIEVAEGLNDPDVSAAIAAMPAQLLELLYRPDKYTGLASEKANEIAAVARRQLAA